MKNIKKRRISRNAQITALESVERPLELETGLYFFFLNDVVSFQPDSPPDCWKPSEIVNPQTYIKEEIV